MPVIRAIQDAAPGTRFTWIIGRLEHQLLEGLDGVEFIVLDKSRGRDGYRDLRRTLRGRRFPLLLNMHPSMRATLASLAVKAPLRLGFDRARSRDLHWLVCNRHIAPRRRQHVMDALFGFAEALGARRGTLRWDIPIPDSARAFAAEQVAGHAPTVVISPCAVARFRNFRNWHAPGYAAVADYAVERYGARVILTGGPSEEEQAYGRAIVERCRTQPVNLIGRTSLKQLLALLERAAVVVTPDSGPAHMATAVRTPVIGLYATTNRFRAAPYLSQNLVVDKYPEAVRRYLGKSVDEVRWGTRVRTPEAMNLIEVADVTAKLDQALGTLRDPEPNPA